MANEPNGIAGALARAVADAEAPGAEPVEQLSFLAEQPLLGEIKVEGRVVNRGRPPGARNKRTEDLAAYILSRHRHPVVAAAEIVDTPIQELAKALNCDRLEAAQYQRQCMEFVARYTLQAMPQAIRVDGATAGQLMVINMQAPRPGENGALLSAHGLDMVIQQNQDVRDAAADASHGDKSHGEPK